MLSQRKIQPYLLVEKLADAEHNMCITNFVNYTYFFLSFILKHVHHSPQVPAYQSQSHIHTGGPETTGLHQLIGLARPGTKEMEQHLRMIKVYIGRFKTLNIKHFFFKSQIILQQYIPLSFSSDAPSLLSRAEQVLSIDGGRWSLDSPV